MSELKVYVKPLKTNVLGQTIVGQSYYLKYEADKVIAEKDAEIAELKDSIGKLLKSKTEQIMDEVLEKVVVYGEGFVPVEYAMKLVAEIRHSKYKRCLAMAKWCESENYTACWYHENSERCEWTERWHKRWLELAEKFKPNNSTAQ